MSYISNDEYIKAFGKHLRAIRLEKGFTCEKLEELTNIDAKQISRLERGERSPTLTTIYYLSKGLEIKPLKLLEFDFVDDEENNPLAH